jgi:hypothetical protein
VRDDLTFVLVERIEEVLPAAFNHDAGAHGSTRFGTGIAPASA